MSRVCFCVVVREIIFFIFDDVTGIPMRTLLSCGGNLMSNGYMTRCLCGRWCGRNSYADSSVWIPVSHPRGEKKFLMGLISTLGL